MNFFHKYYNIFLYNYEKNQKLRKYKYRELKKKIKAFFQ